MMVSHETLLDKLRIFHKSFKHPIDEKFPIPNHKVHPLKKLRRI